ncbi:MAG: hypothetical protein M3R11_02380 [Acidobacteriota bacterium]|nr:hypothetical protein [Acidobacteriota bacterium]
MILLQIRLNLYEIAMMGAALGLLLGLIPLILGFIKKERSYAVFGFLGSIIGGSILGVFLSLPIVAIFAWLILRKPKNEPVDVRVVNETPIDVKVENSENR